MAVDNNSCNSFALQPTPTLVEVDRGSNNNVNNVYESLLAPVLVGTKESLLFKKRLLQSYRISTRRAGNARKSVIYSNCKETVNSSSSTHNKCLQHQVLRLPSKLAKHASCCSNPDVQRQITA
uniref:Uncharacterized protein n=1 Tax=Oryza punctata TaxID=4537 RepID=A0A0E0MER6_ORYPU